MKKNRLCMLDFIRVVCALLIFARHSISSFGLSYGDKFDNVICELTAPVMTTFFIISGFSIHYNYRTEELSTSWIRQFIIKRMISIMPSYLLITMIWPIVYPSQLREWLILFPVEILGVQTAYNSLFGILHNGGTWFVSCLILSYMFYPLIKGIFESIEQRISLVVLIVISFLLIYSPVILFEFSLESFYSNPLYRLGEFVVGVSFADIIFIDKNSMFYPGGAVACLFMISTFVSLLYTRTVNIRTFLVVPIILFLVLVGSMIHNPNLEKNKILSILVGMSYQFYLIQIYLWDLTRFVLSYISKVFVFSRINIYSNNSKKIVSLFLCLTSSFLIWQFYDKPIKRHLIRIIGKSS